MKKVDVARLCNILCILFIFGFAINTIVDYVNYSSMLNSAPFRLWVYVNMACYILPAFIMFLVGRRIRKELKLKKKKS